MPSPSRRARFVDRAGATGQDQRLGATALDLVRVDVASDDLGVDVALANPSGDELRVLGAEVEDEDGVWRHGRKVSRAAIARRSCRAAATGATVGGEQGGPVLARLVPRPRTMQRWLSAVAWCVCVWGRSTGRPPSGPEQVGGEVA